MYTQTHMHTHIQTHAYIQERAIRRIIYFPAYKAFHMWQEAVEGAHEVCTHTHTHTHTHTCACWCMHSYTFRMTFRMHVPSHYQGRAYTCTCIHMYMHCTHMYMHILLHMYMHTHIHIHMFRLGEHKRSQPLRTHICHTRMHTLTCAYLHAGAAHESALGHHACILRLSKVGLDSMEEACEALRAQGHVEACHQEDDQDKT